jgi:hypothetical protein
MQATYLSTTKNWMSKATKTYNSTIFNLKPFSHKQSFDFSFQFKSKAASLNIFIWHKNFNVTGIFRDLLYRANALSPKLLKIGKMRVEKCKTLMCPH